MADLPPFLQFKRSRRGDQRAVDPSERGPRDSGGGQTFLPGAATATNGAPPPAPRVNPALGLDPAAAEPPAPAPVGVTEAPAAAAAPAVSPEERRGMGPAPLQRNAKGQAVGKPEYDDTGDRAADLENYRQGLEAQRNPEHKGSRWWTALKEAGLGFITGGLHGAAVRGIRGVAAPNIEERRDRDREIARVEGEQGRVRTEQGWQAKLAEAQADIEQKKAGAEYTRQRPAIESDRNDLRRDIANEGFETRKAIATMTDTTRRSEGDANRSTRKEIATDSNVSRERVAENNLRFRKEESEANRKLRQEQFAGHMKLGWANYAQRIEEAKQRAAQAADADRARGINTAVSYAKAKAQADAKRFDLPDYIDILTEAGIKVEK
jgi:hypothetical protein